MSCYVTLTPCQVCLTEQPGAQSDKGAYCRVCGALAYGLVVRVAEVIQISGGVAVYAPAGISGAPGECDAAFVQAGRSKLETTCNERGERVFR